MKQSNFVVEMTENSEGQRKYVIRDIQGRILAFADSASDLAQFFDSFKFAV